MGFDPNQDRSRCERCLPRCLGDDVRLVQVNVRKKAATRSLTQVPHAPLYGLEVPADALFQ
jgi:hypothetical protein